MIAGGEFFRPAGIAVAPDGSLYIGDWVDRSYELHKKGRIWRVRLREETSSPERVPGINSLDRATREAAARQMISEGEVGVRSLESALRDVEHPRVRSVALAALISSHKITAEGAAFTLQDSEEAIREQAARMLPSELADSEGVASSDPSAAVRAAALRRLEDESAIPLVLEALDTHDPFLFQAASMALRKSSDDSLLLSLLKHTSPRVRLAALLQLRGGAPGDPTASHLDFRSREQALAVALQDPDDLILRTAVEWIGRDEMIGFHARLIEDLPLKASTPELLEAYLAALAQLDGVMKKWTKGSTGDWWIKAVDAYRYLEPLLEKPGLSPDVAVQILRSLPVSHAALTLAKLQSLLDSADQELQIAVVQRLSDLDEDAAQLLLFALAGDVKYAADVRAEAVVGIKLSSAGLDQLLELAVTQNGVVRDEALRSLRGAPLSENQLRRLRTIVVDAGGTSELLQRILNPSQFSLATSTDLDRWESRLAGHGDAKAGRRVFFHPRGPGCSKCHRIDGRGQSVGPNLVRVDGRLALSRRRLIEAIVAPGREVDPGYLPLTIATIDGRIATGIYHKHGKGIREIINSRGEIEAFKIDEIEQMRPSRTSIMPDGLAEQMTEQEFRDLLEFLLVGP
jgi:putative heme-binding domain-containing protein